MSDVNRHPIRVVAKRTGLPETTLRAWERRYNAVTPDRADTGRRLYSDQDVERLRLIRTAVDAGRSISDVAGLSDEALRELVEEDRTSEFDPREMTMPTESAPRIIEASMDAIANMDHASLRSALNRAILKFPALQLIDDVIAPLLHRIGDYWYDNRFSPRHEHMASSVVRTILTQLQAGIQHTGPETIVVTTPPGQLHDLGTQFVSALGLAEGWGVVNLGANITAPDVVATANEVGASIVALSIVYPEDDPAVEETLSYLGEHLEDNVRLVVGGRAADTYLEAIEGAGGLSMQTAREFGRLLSEHG